MIHNHASVYEICFPRRLLKNKPTAVIINTGVIFHARYDHDRGEERTS